MVELIFEIIISAAVTAFTYGVGPFILCKVRKRSLKLLYLRIFCISYSAVIWFVWQLLTYDGASVRTMPAVFWGYISYRLAKASMQKKPASLTPAIPASEKPVERLYVCPKCGQLVRDGERCDCEKDAAKTPEAELDPPPSKGGKNYGRQKMSLRISVFACAFLFVCSCGIGLLAYRNYSTAAYLTQKNLELSEKNLKLDDKVKDLSARLTKSSREAQEATADSQEWEAKYHEAFDKYFIEIFCESPQNLVKQRITPHFLTTDHPNYYEFTTEE